MMPQRLMMLVVCLLGAATATAGELDPSFEQVAKSGQPAQWIAHRDYPFDTFESVQRDPVLVRSGEASLHVARASEGFGRLYSREDVVVEIGRKYTLSVWVRGHGELGGWTFLYQVNENGDASFLRTATMQPTDTNPRDNIVPDDGQWHQFQFTFQLDDAKARTARPVLLARGDMVIDDVQWLADGEAIATEQQAAPRTNRVVVARQSTPPTIDGRFHFDEYAVAVAGLMDRESHSLYPWPASYGFSHDGERLYFAMSVQLPPGYELDTSRRERDDPNLVAAHDAMIMMVRSDGDTDAAGFEGAYVAVAANGAVYDAWESVSWSKNYCTRDAAFDAGWQVRTDVRDGRWTVELSAPIDDLRFDGDGLIAFGLNLGGAPVTWQLHPNWFDHPQAFGQLKLADTGPTVRVPQIGAIARGDAQPIIDLTNQNDRPIDYQTMAVLSVPRMVAGRIGSYIFDMAMDVRQSRMVRDQSVWFWQEDGRLEPGATQQLADTFDMPAPGSYLMELDVRAGGETVLYQMLPFHFAPPIDVTMTPVPSRDEIDTIVSLRGSRPEERGELRIAFRNADGKTALTHTQRVDQDELKLPLAMADLVPGEYAVDFALHRPDGTLAATATHVFTKQSTPVWLTEPAGIDALDADWTPDPWTPVQTGRNTVEVWGRRYTFERGSFVAAIESQSRNLLSEPATINYAVGGRTQTIAMQSPRIESVGRGRAKVHQHGESDSLQIDAVHTIEFDGMQRVDLTITPVATTKVDQLWIELPFANFPYSVLTTNEGAAAQYWQRGLASDDLFATPRAHTIVWLGDEDVGCAYFAENYKGWRVDSTRPRVDMQSDKQSRRLRLLLVNVPATIDEPMQLTFGLHATPVKPMFAGWRDMRPVGLGIEPPPANITFTHASIWNSGDSKPSPRSWHVLEDIVSYTHAMGVRTYPYIGTYFYSPYDYIKPEAPFDPRQQSFPPEFWIRKREESARRDAYFYHGEDWQLVPPRVSEPKLETRQEARTAAGSSWADFFAHGIEQLLIRTDVDGLYLDIANPMYDMNPDRGLVSTTLDGKREGSIELFAARDLYKRLYHIFEKHRGAERRPWMFGHGFAVMLPYSPFWDANFNCEEVKPEQPFGFTAMNLQRSLVGTPLAKRVDDPAARDYNVYAWRALFAGASGLPNVILPQYAYRSDLKTIEHSREMIMWTFIHNNILWPAYVEPQPVRDFWNMVELPYGMGDTEFHPYWTNGVSASPQSVKVSYWSKPGREDYLVAVANFGREPVKALVTLPEPLSRFDRCVEMESVSFVPCNGTLEAQVPGCDMRVFRFRPEARE